MDNIKELLKKIDNGEFEEDSCSCGCGGKKHEEQEEHFCCKHEHHEEKHDCCEHKHHEKKHDCCGHKHDSADTETDCCGREHHHDDGCGCCGEKKDAGIRTQLILLAVSLASLILGYFDWQHIGFMPFYYVNPAWVAVIICGAPIIKSAVKNLIRNKKITSALLISIATLACIALAIASFFPSVQEVINSSSSHNHSYVFAAGEVVFLMSLGGLIEDFTVKKTRSGIENLTKLIPKNAVVITENGYEERALTQVNVGDTVLCKAGEMIAVDGKICEGSTSIDTSSVTGEYVPQECSVGDAVYGGTVNQTQTVKILVTKPPKEMTIARMADLVKEAGGKKSPIAKIADKWASIIVPVTLVISVLVGIIARFALKTSNIEAIIRLCTVLVVFCPCSLALATPTAISAALGNSAKNGVLIKSGAALETLAKIDTVCVDKTGTLTTAQITVDEIKTYDFDEKELLRLVASTEQHSGHPIAKALVSAAENLSEPINMQTLQGVGISATVEDKNIMVVSYNSYLKQHDKLVDAENFLADGKTVICAVIDDELRGIIALSDTIKESAITAVAALKNAGINVIMLTGDNEQSAKAVASKCGIDEIRASLLPEDKLTVIEELQKQGKKVCMLGDGINDAPSLATANCGVAMGALGADIAIDTADMAIMNNDLNKLVDTIRLSKRTLRKVGVNITVAMLVNVIATVLSMFGWLTPLTGALVHNCTSVLVVSNSALLLINKKNK